MKTFILCLGAVLAGNAVLAQSVPVYRYGQCPTSTYASGNSCVPVNNSQVYWNGGGFCPQGWTSSKGYCYRR